MTRLNKWAIIQIYRTILPKQGQIKPDKIEGYLSALKSYQIDRHLGLKKFDNLQMALIIKSEKRIFSSRK